MSKVVSLLLGVQALLGAVVHAQHEPYVQVPLSSLPNDGVIQNTPKTITPEFSMYVENLMKEGGVPGLALGVVHATGETEYGAWGVRSEEGEVMSTDTTIYLASCSKAFLSASMGILMDDFAQGRNVTALPNGVDIFDWDTKIKELLPEEWVLMDKWMEQKANVRDALSHSTGMYRHDLSYGPREKPVEIIGKMRYLKPSFELRGQYSYNNLMYMLGSHIIATYSNMPYTSFVSERIFKPLGMSSTTYSANEANGWGRATQSWTPFGRRIPVWFGDDNIMLNSGPGGVISCVDDLEKWVRTFLNLGVDPRTNKTIIPRLAFEEVTTAHVIDTGKPPSAPESIQGYGMGWWRNSYIGHDVVAHSGSIPGVATRISFLPSDGLGIIVLVNADDKANVATIPITQKIISNLFGLPTDGVERRTEQKEIEQWASREPNDISLRQPGASMNRAVNKDEIDINLEAYTGTYNNSGYGSFALCTAYSTSQYCTEVLSNFTTVDSASSVPYTRNSAKELYASFPRLWSSHLRFVHLEGHKFHLEATNLFPEGYGRDQTPFEAMSDGSTGGVAVEFVVGVEGQVEQENGGIVQGFGLMDLIEGKTARTARERGSSVQGRADVWFERSTE